MINEEELKLRAVENAEQNGIVFIDEIDKIARRQETTGADVSREGVQRDLLPLVEGTRSRPSTACEDRPHAVHRQRRVPHGQALRPDPRVAGAAARYGWNSIRFGGRFREHLHPAGRLSHAQYTALLETEGVTLQLPPEGIKRLAEIAFAVNETTENIGARRLYTVMEKLLEKVSFDAGKRNDETLTIDATVDAQLEEG